MYVCGCACFAFCEFVVIVQHGQTPVVLSETKTDWPQSPSLDCVCFRLHVGKCVIMGECVLVAEWLLDTCGVSRYFVRAVLLPYDWRGDLNKFEKIKHSIYAASYVLHSFFTFVTQFT